jgi:hypothetical protein
VISWQFYPPTNHPLFTSESPSSGWCLKISHGFYSLKGKLRSITNRSSKIMSPSGSDSWGRRNGWWPAWLVRKTMSWVDWTAWLVKKTTSWGRSWVSDFQETRTQEGVREWMRGGRYRKNQGKSWGKSKPNIFTVPNWRGLLPARYILRGQPQNDVEKQKNVFK